VLFAEVLAYGHGDDAGSGKSLFHLEEEPGFTAGVLSAALETEGRRFDDGVSQEPHGKHRGAFRKLGQSDLLVLGNSTTRCG